MLKKITINTVIVLVLISTVKAESMLKPIIQFGYDVGGTTLATVYNNYDGVARIRAGQGVRLEAGAVISDKNNPLELQFFVGYKLDQESASNGSVNWDSAPFTALAMIKNGNWKFGGGATYQLDPHLSGSFVGYDNRGVFFNDSVNDRYEDALGGVAQIDYMVNRALSIGLRGTFIDYKLKNNPSVTAQGDSIGFNMSYTFGYEYSRFR